MTKTGQGTPGHPLWGHLPALRQDPLRFLTLCAQGEATVVPLRLPLLHAFLLLDPADIERVLITDHRHFVKPLWLRTPAVRRLLGDGLVTSDGPSWRDQRRACQPAFHPGLMDDYGRIIMTLAERALESWQVGQTRDVQHDATRLTLEIVAGTLMQVDIAAEAGEISATMDTLMRCFSAGRSLFGLLPLPPTPQESTAARRLDRLVDAIIRAAPKTCRAEAEGRAPNLLSLLMTGQEGRAGKAVRHRRLREQVKTFLAAGHESSALVLTWALLLLAQNPEAGARLSAELQEVLGDRAPTPADLPKLPYTQAIVKETLRLYPPLWMTGRKSVRRCEIGGALVPAGSLILTSQWAMQRHPRYFPGPNDFRPERWEGPETALLPRFAYFPFGGGPRVCIGQGFAMMETALLLSAIARRFRLEIAPGPEVFPWATMTLRPPVGLQMRLCDRNT